MQSKEYIKNAIRTESVPESLVMHQVVFADLLRNMVVMAQIGDLMKRKLFYDKDIDTSLVAVKANEIYDRFERIFKSIQSRDVNTRENFPPEALEQIAGFTEKAKFGDMDNVNIRLLHCALGSYTESGELLESIVKQLLTGHLDKVNFGEEVGDIEWYQAIGFDESGVSEESCRVANINKLKSRYPDKFNNIDAEIRDLEAERFELVGGMSTKPTSHDQETEFYANRYRFLRTPGEKHYVAVTDGNVSDVYTETDLDEIVDKMMAKDQ